MPTVDEPPREDVLFNRGTLVPLDDIIRLVGYNGFDGDKLIHFFDSEAMRIIQCKSPIVGIING